MQRFFKSEFMGSPSEPLDKPHGPQETFLAWNSLVLRATMCVRAISSPHSEVVSSHDRLNNGLGSGSRSEVRFFPTSRLA